MIQLNNTDVAVRTRVLETAGRIDALTAMALNRKDRRALAKLNKGNKILGTSKPFIKVKR